VASKQARSKARGMGYQRKVAEMIRKSFGLSKDDCKSTPAGVNGPDITLSTLGQKKFPYSLELKYCKTISLPSWLRQSEEGAYRDTVPVVGFHSFDQKKDYVVLPLSHFIEITAPDKLKPCTAWEDGQFAADSRDSAHARPRVCGKTFARKKCTSI